LSVNPYLPPKAALVGHRAGDYWRDGKTAVVKNGGVLPARCVCCNEVAVEPLQSRRMYWHPAGWYLLFLINVAIYVVVALFVRKRGEVAYGVCARHRLRRRLFIAGGWGGFLLGLYMLSFGGTVAAAGVMVSLVCAVAGFIGARLVYPARITKDEVHLNGCGTAFLESLQSASEAALTRGEAKLLPAGSGSCPNCAAIIPIASTECPSCKALFGPESAWQVEPVAKVS